MLGTTSGSFTGLTIHPPARLSISISKLKKPKPGSWIRRRVGGWVVWCDMVGEGIERVIPYLLLT